MHLPFTYKTNKYQRIIQNIFSQKDEEKSVICTKLYFEQKYPFYIKAIIYIDKYETENQTEIKIEISKIDHPKVNKDILYIYDVSLKAFLNHSSKINSLIENKKYISIIDAILEDINCLIISKNHTKQQIFKTANFQTVKDDKIYIGSRIYSGSNISVHFQLKPNGHLKTKIRQNEICEKYTSKNDIIYYIPIWKPLKTTDKSFLEDYKKLKTHINNNDQNLITDITRKWFKKYINHHLENNYVEADHTIKNTQKYYVEKGSIDEIYSIIKYSIYSHPEIKKVKNWPIPVFLLTKTKEREQIIYIDHCPILENSKKIKKIFSQLSKENIITGWICRPKGISQERLSDFEILPIKLLLEIEKPSLHEITDAHIKIKNYLK